MKITKQNLRRLIKEETNALIKEREWPQMNPNSKFTPDAPGEFDRLGPLRGRGEGPPDPSRVPAPVAVDPIVAKAWNLLDSLSEIESFVGGDPEVADQLKKVIREVSFLSNLAASHDVSQGLSRP